MSLKKITFLIAVLLICIAGDDAVLNADLEESQSLQDRCSGIVRTAVLTENGGLGADEYAVYSSLIEEICLTDKNRSMPIPIRDHTDFPELRGVSIGKSLKSLQPQTLEDLMAKNSQKFELVRQFNLSIDYQLVNERDNPGVEDIVGLSRVGFNTKKTQALVHVDEIKRWYVNEGYLVLMEKENGGWKVEEKEMTYIGE